MQIVFTETAFDDLLYWSEHDPKIIKKLIRLIEDFRREPFTGIGKPEALKFDYSGYWSRRISQEHRLVYKIEGNKRKNQICTIIQCRFHY
jgi:toxin YoeB